MAHIVIKKGHDLRIAGKPARDVVVADPPRQVALHPSEFRYVKPKMLVKEGDRVQRGTPLFFDKLDDRIRWASPAGGTVVNIERGPRRRLDAIVIELESEESVVEGTAYPPEQLASLE
ncbi:MAG: NADH:ubiquinone reductase (Na(+)-transporting) subunit A, partial [Candidatus Neomarinimicrobiota bacterium]